MTLLSWIVYLKTNGAHECQDIKPVHSTDLLGWLNIYSPMNSLSWIAKLKTNGAREWQRHQINVHMNDKLPEIAKERSKAMLMEWHRIQPTFLNTKPTSLTGSTSLPLIRASILVFYTLFKNDEIIIFQFFIRTLDFIYMILL